MLGLPQQPVHKQHMMLGNPTCSTGTRGQQRPTVAAEGSSITAGWGYFKQAETITAAAPVMERTQHNTRFGTTKSVICVMFKASQVTDTRHRQVQPRLLHGATTSSVTRSAGPSSQENFTPGVHIISNSSIARAHLVSFRCKYPPGF
jgi:hypothetical protein